MQKEQRQDMKLDLVIALDILDLGTSPQLIHGLNSCDHTYNRVVNSKCHY